MRRRDTLGVAAAGMEASYDRDVAPMAARYLPPHPRRADRTRLRREGHDVTTGEIDQATGQLATAVGAVAIAADAVYVAFAAFGEPFGSVNDAGYAATGILAGSLAWRLRSRAGTAPTAAALGGAAVAAAGSGLVLTGTTGWLLAGFVSAVGFGLIGPSVVAASSSLSRDGVVPPRLATLGLVAGSVMTLGLTAVVPVAMRVDDAATAPAWTWFTMVGWFGTAIAYPAWAIWLGRVAGRRADRSAQAAS